MNFYNHKIPLGDYATFLFTPVITGFGAESKLKKIDMTGFDTSAVTNMGSMFNKCKNLKTLTLGNNFKTDNVTDMNYMFYNCESLTSIDLSEFNTSNVKKMHEMFHGCKSLTELNVSKFDTSKVTDMSLMFYGCTSLTSLVGGTEHNIRLTLQVLKLLTKAKADTLQQKLSNYRIPCVQQLSYNGHEIFPITQCSLFQVHHKQHNSNKNYIL